MTRPCKNKYLSLYFTLWTCFQNFQLNQKSRGATAPLAPLLPTPICSVMIIHSPVHSDVHACTYDVSLHAMSSFPVPTTSQVVTL